MQRGQNNFISALAAKGNCMVFRVWYIGTPKGITDGFNKVQGQISSANFLFMMAAVSFLCMQYFST